MADKLRITIPDDHVPERRYAVDMLVKHWLDVEYSLSTAKIDHYILENEEGRVLIEDHFFGHCEVDGDYVRADRLPHWPVECQYTLDRVYPVLALYGRDSIESNGTHWRCGIDLFASTFFMLTRWEERLPGDRDDHDRLPTESHLSVRYGFSDRAVVNEWAEFLGGLLRVAGHEFPVKKNRSELVLSHDLDRIYGGPWLRSVRTCLKPMQPRRIAVDHFYRLRRIDFRNTIRAMLDRSEAGGIRARLYVIAGGENEKEGYYSLDEPRVLDLLTEVRSRGHIIGFHPSYWTYRDEGRWNAERDRLESAIGDSVREGRQHYLRFDPKRTWRIWERAGMDMDSTMGFADRVGFRCGTGDPYPLYDIEERTPKSLLEQPLLLMDSALLKVDDPEQALDRLRNTCFRHGMTCTMLFHNHLLDPVPWNHMQRIWSDLIDSWRGSS